MPESYAHAQQLSAVMKRIYERGLTTSSGGNLSVMDETGTLWITPGGTDKALMTAEDIIRIKPDGTVTGKGRPSVETPMHRAIYAARPDIRAIIHAHPPTLNAFSMVNRLPNIRMYPQAAQLCGKSSISAYACPGTAALAQVTAEEFKKDSEMVLMQNHGLIIGCQSLLKAYIMLETLDCCAAVEQNCLALGKAVSLTDMQIDSYRLSRHEGPFTSDIPEKEAELLLQYTHRAYKQGLFTATQGAFSVRISDNSFITTAYDADAAMLTIKDVILVSDGKPYGSAQPYWKMHAEIYRQHPEALAAATAQPPAVMAFAATHTHYDTHLIPESYTLLREITSAPFGTVLKEPEKAAQLLCVNAPILLSQNECVAVLGKSLLNAFDKLEVAEFCGRSIINANLLGEITSIGKEHFADILRMLPC